MPREARRRQSEESEGAAGEGPPVWSEAAPPAEEPEAPQREPATEEAQGAPRGEAAPAAPARAERAERRRRGRPAGRRKVCAFCVEHVDVIDYKDPIKLRRYLSDRGRIEPRRKTGTCAKHQRRLSVALKRARHLALLPYTAEHIRQTGVFTPRS